MPDKAVNTHGKTITFGRHSGELFTRLPVSYLKWMVNTGTRQADLAAAELERRGTVTPHLEISGHAIDRASLSCRKIWHEDREEREGLHAWLVRVAGEALEAHTPDEQGRIHHKGMRLVFEVGAFWPVLKTVMPKNRRQSNATQNTS